MIIKFKKSQLKSMLIFVLLTIMLTAVGYALTVKLNAPESGSWWKESSSVLHNFTAYTNSSVESVEYCAIYSDISGSWVLLANYSSGINNGTPFYSGIAWPETNNASVGWNVTCYNGSHIRGPKTPFSLGVDYTIPSITLDSPADDSYDNTNITTFTFTPTDPSNPQYCDFYINLSSTWGINKTNSSFTSGSQNTVILSTEATATIPDGNYIWNVWCNDSAANGKWAENTNRTVTIDVTKPTNIKWTYPSNNTFSSDTTPYLVWNQTTEVNFQKYEVLVATELNLSPTIQTIEITNRTANFTTLANIPANDQYYIQVRAYDLAGNKINSTSILFYSTSATSPSLALGYPSNNTYTLDNTPDFNVTVTDSDPDICLLYLSDSSGGNMKINLTVDNIVSGTRYNMTPITLVDGTYKFNIGCNDSENNRVNISTSDLDLTVDTNNPSRPNITISWGQTNNTDKTPQLMWYVSTDINFQRYLAQAFYLNNGSVAYEVNVTSNATNHTDLNLVAGYTYNFSVTAYDLAGNYNKSADTTANWYYVDTVCGTLNFGWNLCGATWESAKNLSRIGSETSANFVAVWNNSHQWQTCNYAVSPSGTNCDISVNITNNAVSSVWIYVNSSTQWRNRTWVATQANMNYTLSNTTSGWNIVAGVMRNGRSFGLLGRSFTSNNVSMFSMPYNNGSSVPFVNKYPFNQMSVNLTILDYGRAMWVYYNGTLNTTAPYGSQHTFDIGGW